MLAANRLISVIAKHTRTHVLMLHCLNSGSHLGMQERALHVVVRLRVADLCDRLRESRRDARVKESNQAM